MKVDGTLGFLGFGNMGQAIAGGLLQTGVMSGDQGLVYDIDEEKQQKALEMGLRVAGSPDELARASNTLMLAVKPQSMAEALERAKHGLSPATLVVSIAAGISTGFIRNVLGQAVRVVRVMPNTPALVRAGAAGIALSDNCDERDAGVVRTIFEAVGTAGMVPEDAIDAVTAVSGSGPAYFFYLVECLVKAGIREGLPESQATSLAAQTLYGAGKLLAESGESPTLLREKVTSKGGTTAAALASFAENGFEDIVARAVAAAAARSRELGK